MKNARESFHDQQKINNCLYASQQHGPKKQEKGLFMASIGSEGRNKHPSINQVKFSLTSKKPIIPSRYNLSMSHKSFVVNNKNEFNSRVSENYGITSRDIPRPYDKQPKSQSKERSRNYVNLKNQTEQQKQRILGGSTESIQKNASSSYKNRQSQYQSSFKNLIYKSSNIKTNFLLQSIDSRKKSR